MNDTLSLGPLLYHWPAAYARDFYFRVADEMDVDCVFLGEVVCSKRQPFHAPYYREVIERLQQAGKHVIFSTQALINSHKEREKVLESLRQHLDLLIELNDLSLLTHLSEASFAIGPYINIYNESTLKWLEAKGATLVTLPFELSRQTLQVLAQSATASLAVHVFGRMPLAISARCYHARAFHLPKKSCLFVCGKHTDGMEVQTLDNQPFLTINGTQTQSHTYVNLLHELPALQAMGIHHFRLSPHTLDMVKIAALFRAVLQKTTALEQAFADLQQLAPAVCFSNGFYHQHAGNSLHPQPQEVE